MQNPNPHSPRIVSFLPSATEMAFALGLSEQLVGVTHECDYPPEAKSKPIVVRAVLPVESMSQSEIDHAVTKRMRNGQSLYQIDEELLRELAPDLILTQNLCQVCAPSGNEVSQLLKALSHEPEILWLTPKSVAEIFENLRALGAATGRLTVAEELIDNCRTRLEKLAAETAGISHHPRVFCMEWLDPVYACGHWVPEMVKLAGGKLVDIGELGGEGRESVRISWDQLAEYAPEVLIIMPCGFNLQQTMKQIWISFGPHNPQSAIRSPQFFNLPAVRDGQVYAVDANAYFARPGPRVVEGTELLAHLIHPEVFPEATDPQSLTPGVTGRSYQRVDTSLLRGSFDEGKDYYREGDAMVFTASYLQRRGYCCDSGCRHCPY